MTSLLSEPVGRQEPRFLSRPACSTSAGVEACDLARQAGLILDPWQELCLEVALGEVDGRWAAPEVGVIVPRQNGKGSILEARELAGLFLFGENLILHSAHEFKTASEAFRRLLSLVEQNDWLESRVSRVRTSHGEEGLELRSGQRIRFVARSTGSGRGFTGDLVILDEAYALTDAHMAALLPTLSARSIQGNPQIWYTSSAPLETSEVLHRLRRRGRVGDNRFAYLEWCALAADEPDAVAEANPGLGIRISPDFCETERASMSAESYARERLGIAPDVADSSAIPLDAWKTALKPDTPGAPVCFSLDCTPDRGWSSIATADRTVVELVDHRRATGWVYQRCLELWERWHCRFLVDGAGPAGSLGAELERQGVTIEYLGAKDVARACNLFHDDIIEGRCTVLDPFSATTPAVVGAIKKPSGDTWRWGRNIDGDVSPLMAITLARWGAASPGGTFEPMVAWR